MWVKTSSSNRCTLIRRSIAYRDAHVQTVHTLYYVRCTAPRTDSTHYSPSQNHQQPCRLRPTTPAIRTTAFERFEAERFEEVPTVPCNSPLLLPTKVVANESSTTKNIYIDDKRLKKHNKEYNPK